MTAHTESKFNDYVLRPSLAGLAGMGVSYYLGYGQQSIAVLGMNISSPIAFGVAIGLSSSLSELAYDTILSNVTKNDRLLSVEGFLLGPLTVASSMLGISYFASGELVWNNFLLGAGIEAASQYTWGTIESGLMPEKKEE